MDENLKHFVNRIQAVVVIAAVSLGVIPLIQSVFGRRQSGPFRFVFNEPTKNLQWIIPIAVIVAATAIVIAVEELPKRHGE